MQHFVVVLEKEKEIALFLVEFSTTARLLGYGDFFLFI
jgi:hypothetical protein